MQKAFLLSIGLLLLGGGLRAQTSPRKAVFIIVDGIPADVVEKVPTPHLDAIAKVGGYTRAYTGGEAGGYSETPTISAVGYNSLLTGTWANKHNVWGNGIKDPNYHYPTIFRLFKDQYPDKKTAVFSTWLDNRTKLIGEGLAATGHVQVDYDFDGFELDTVRFPHDRQSEYIHQIDELVTDEAARYLRAEGPDLSWVYLEYTDDMGHRFGDSPQQTRAVEIVDQQVGRIWAALQERQQRFGEEWMILITTDHGRDAKTGKDHGGQSERERTIWITTNLKDLNPHFHNDQPGMVDILPTMTRFLGIDVPRATLLELDGVPLTGPVSLTDPQVQYQNGKLQLSWNALEKKGDVQVWVSTTNHVKDRGQQDAYQRLATVPLKKEAYTLDVSTLPSEFYKVVLEGSHNAVNRWVRVTKSPTP
ncbi:Type I phosphodiesterase / nucleotide pyrophosphatase [Catalinimonas alkaloidigena]|uniref:Type I phosphodiesterase / nucleotide pyrophosphatase n=1 Tax=Catalinimonas alkaloidigena TaxID=1075417 RepID=A0A1G9P211_9BACT|nr:alkaline phosphatase family protein [Catalinimonas alkaloidigena]SDL92679.1 Type I phosphodiesterase / nucleotide pyrophosphatase [Catalinimonas alkaloidigena]